MSVDYLVLQAHITGVRVLVNIIPYHNDQKKALLLLFDAEGQVISGK